jgi:hypothetical protein
VGDSFKGDVYLIDRRTGTRRVLTGGHVMKPDHAHPIVSADGRRVLLQSGRLTGGQSLDLVVVALPAALPERAEIVATAGGELRLGTATRTLRWVARTGERLIVDGELHRLR